MGGSGFALFGTAIGRCGVAWGSSGLVGTQLPEASDPAAAARLSRRFPGLRPADPSPEAREAIERITALLDGGKDDLCGLVVDFGAASAWDKAVYRETRAIAPGKTTTYGALAARLGDAAQARAVGQSLGRNPWPIVIPCHRVTGAAGKAGGFSAPGGVTTKKRLLEIEGAFAADSLPLFSARDER